MVIRRYASSFKNRSIVMLLFFALIDKYVLFAIKTKLKVEDMIRATVKRNTIEYVNTRLKNSGNPSKLFIRI